MDILLEKKKMKDYIDSISDRYLLQYLHGVMRNIDNKINLDPHTEEGLKNRIELSSKQIAEGNGLSLEEVRDKFGVWNP